MKYNIKCEYVGRLSASCNTERNINLKYIMIKYFWQNKIEICYCNTVNYNSYGRFGVPILIRFNYFCKLVI